MKQNKTPKIKYFILYILSYGEEVIWNMDINIDEKILDGDIFEIEPSQGPVKNRPIINRHDLESIFVRAQDMIILGNYGEMSYFRMSTDTVHSLAEKCAQLKCDFELLTTETGTENGKRHVLVKNKAGAAVHSNTKQKL